MSAPQRVEQIVARELIFPEGPSVHEDGSLYVVELAGRRVTRVLPDGSTEVFATIEGSPNGSAFGPDGALYICNNGGRWAGETCTGGEWGPGGYPAAIQRIWPDGRVEDVVREIDGVPLESPNDLCFGPDGGFWFTDPIWPDEAGVCPPGFVGYSDLDGRAVRIPTDLQMPNGIGVTDDGSTLLVSASRTFSIHAFDILGPGVLGPGRRFALLDDGVFPDGMCFDAEGRVFCAGHGGSAVYVFSASGHLEEKIPVGDKDVSNVCFGGPDRRRLYMTESDMGCLAAIEWDTPGMVLFPARAGGAA